MSTTTYREQSRVFLAQASEELERGDLRQASEKGWGAASQIVKAAADARGWEHDYPGALHRAIHGIVKETGNTLIRQLFAVAGELYYNSLDHFLEPEDVATYLSDVELLVDEVDALLPGGATGVRGRWPSPTEVQP